MAIYDPNNPTGKQPPVYWEQRAYDLSNIRAEAEVRRDSPGDPLIDERIAKERQAIAAEIREAETRLRNRRDVRKPGADRDIRMLAREANMYSPTKGYAVRDEKGVMVHDANNNPVFLSEDELKDAVRKGDKAEKDLREKYDKFKKGLESNLAQKKASGAPNREFHITDVLTSLASGQIGPALGELAQPFGGPLGRMSKRFEERATTAREASQGAGGFGRFLGGAKGVGWGMLAKGVGPPGLIAALAIGRQVNQFQQEMTRSGQVTGEGFGAGIAAQREQFSLSANPFDILDRRTAAEMVRGVRSKGFKGEIGRAMQDSIGSVFRDLGTDWQGNLEMLTSVVDNNVMSIDEFTGRMKDLDTQAKESGVSVQALQDGLKGMLDLKLAQGGPSAGAAFVEATPFLNQAFANTGLLRDEKLFGLIGGALPQWAMQYAGMSQVEATGPEAEKRQGEIMDILAEKLRSLKAGSPYANDPKNEHFARYLIQNRIAEALLPGFTNVGDLAQFLNVILKGGMARRQATATAEANVDLARDKVRPGQRGAGFGMRGGYDAYPSSVTNDEPLARGRRDQLQTLVDKMSDAGISPTVINQMVAPLRESIYGTTKPVQQRYNEFDERFSDVADEAQTIIEIQLSPEAASSGLKLNEKSKHQTYITRGGGSQGTVRPPANRGDTSVRVRGKR